MTQSDDLESPEKKWPSVNLAYQFALESYEIARKRLDEADDRLESMITFIGTVTIAVPTVAVALSKVSKPDFQSLLFGVGIIAWITAIVLGVCGRATGHLEIVSPLKLHSKWLHYSEWEFKQNMIYEAGQAFEKNRTVINKKGKFLTWMSWLFVAGAVALFAWLSLVVFLGSAASVYPQT